MYLLPPPLSTRLESSKIDLKFSGIFGFLLEKGFFFFANMLCVLESNPKHYITYYDLPFSIYCNKCVKFFVNQYHSHAIIHWNFLFTMKFKVSTFFIDCSSTQKMKSQFTFPVQFNLPASFTSGFCIHSLLDNAPNYIYLVGCVM